MKPIKLEISNFMSHSASTINFDFQSSLILGEVDGNLEVSNGSGKSSILQAIRWALFGKSRYKSSDAVVKRGEDEAEVCFTFELAGKTYKVSRKRNIKYKKLDLSVFVLDGDTETLLLSDTNKEMEDKLQSILCFTDDIFTNSVYFSQNSVLSFMFATPAERYKLLSAILELDKWSLYAEKAKKMHKAADIKVAEINAKLEMIDGVQSNLEKVQGLLKETESKLSAVEIAEIQLSSKLEELSIQRNKLSGQSESAREKLRLEKLKASLVKELETFSAQKSALVKRKQGFAESLAQLDLKRKEIESKLDSLKSSIDPKAQSGLDAAKVKLAETKTSISSLEKIVAKWEPTGTCNCCGKAWQEHDEKVQEYNDNKKSLDKLKDKLKAVHAQGKELKSVVEKNQYFESEIQKLSSFSYSSEKALIDSGVSSVELREAEIEKTKASKEKDLREAEALLAETKLDVSEDEFEAVNQQYNKLLEDKSGLSEEKSGLERAKGSLLERTKNYEDMIKQQAALTQELGLALKNKSIFEILVRSFSRSGVPSIIIDNVVKELSDCTNEWLCKLTDSDMRVVFVTQKQGQNGSWKETFDIVIFDGSEESELEGLSGGEAFRVAFALRLALAQIKAKRAGHPIQMLLLDEVSSSLDESGRQAFMEIIRVLEKTMTVMVVTHDDHLKDEFVNTITVRKSGSGSTIIQN